MTSSLSFFVGGIPAPQGSKRLVTSHGKPLMLESSKHVKPWRLDIADVARSVSGGFFVKRPSSVILEVVFYFTRPPSHLTAKGMLRKGKPVHPTGKPDGDKLLRAVCDALTGVVFDDDSQITDFGGVRKRFVSRDPGAFITVEEGP